MSMQVPKSAKLNNCQFRNTGSILRPKQLRMLRTFSNSLFDDNQNHESFQQKMTKMSLNVHKRANNLAVRLRGEIGMYPLSTEIYKNMIKYFFHLIELAEKGNQIISCGMNEFLTFVNKGGKCWLTSVLNIFNLVGIICDIEQLYSVSNGDVLSSVVDKLSTFKEKFSMKLRIPQNLSHTATSKRNFVKKNISNEVKYYKYRSVTTKVRISAHTFPVESGRWDKTPREKRVYPLCFSNDIGDEKHYI